jgi:hypothetical protein
MSPTLLDWELERHEGPEPRVVTADVQEILTNVIMPGEDGGDKSVSLIAEKAGISTRTVYRVLQRTTDTISLDLADRLCLAADSHLLNCRLRWPSGEVTTYTHQRAVD